MSFAAFLFHIFLVHPASAATSADYSRAERYLSWNQERYVLNADPEPYWIGREDRLWYWRANPAGVVERVIVDAASGEKTRAFDLAAAAPGDSDCDILSPDGKWAAFLKNHDVWIRPVSGGAPAALTSDGVKHYRYASFSGSSAHAVSDARRLAAIPPQVLWSPDSRFLLTYRLDERQVEDLFLIQSVPQDGRVRPLLHAYRYGMPGDAHLPLLEMFILDVNERRIVRIDAAPLIGLPQTPIEKRDAWWAPDSRAFYYLRRDRHAKSISLERGDPLTGAATTVIEEAADTVAQSNADNVFAAPLVRTLGNGDVIWYSQRDGWGHLYYHDRRGALRHRISGGRWVVRAIERIDERGKRIFFTASGREAGRDPYEQYLYSVRFDGSGLRLLTPEPADHGWPHRSTRFSPSGRYFVDSYSRPDLPPIFVLRTVDGRLIATLEQADISRLKSGGHRPIEPFRVLAADGQTPIYGNLFRPSRFDSARKYPVIDSVYPGPQARRVKKRFVPATFDEFEAQSLAELGFIVVTIDGRGTPNRSKAFLDHAHGRMERASELEDHIAGIRQLAKRYPYMDLDRVGIDGASAGGYAAARGVLAYPDFYKVAVAAEGTHDARGYLAAWGETYEGPLKESAYESASNLPLAANLKGKLFLMHGEMDDNVHPALTLKLADALIRENKDFDLLIMPNGDHFAWKSPYFIRRKWDYFVRHLRGVEPPAGYSIRPPH